MHKHHRAPSRQRWQCGRPPMWPLLFYTFVHVETFIKPKRRNRRCRYYPAPPPPPLSAQFSRRPPMIPPTPPPYKRCLLANASTRPASTTVWSTGPLRVSTQRVRSHGVRFVFRVHFAHSRVRRPSSSLQQRSPFYCGCGFLPSRKQEERLLCASIHHSRRIPWTYLHTFVARASSFVLLAST